MIGFRPENIHIIGKPYSTISSCLDIIKNFGINYYLNLRPDSYGNFKKYFIKDIHSMWKQIVSSHLSKISNLLVLDDGGLCITNTPNKIVKNYKIIGIEQTQNGLDIIKNFKLLYPVVNVASSAVKKKLEPYIITNSIISSIGAKKIENKRCGIVGYGALGSILSKKITSIANELIFYDINSKINSKLKNNAKNVLELFQKTDILFGCTGVDITKIIFRKMLSFENNKTLVSCSSGDYEFNSLLNKLHYKPNEKKLTTNIEYIYNKFKLQILNGGFPINFNRQYEVEPIEHIQLTRTLLFIGIIQSLFMENKKNTNLIYKLDALLQKSVVNNWVKYIRNKEINIDEIKYFNSCSWINYNSEGKICKLFV
jgi:S-adenosylhomocysteine hydrolase